ncbi:3-hydroxyacyl-CoA dehydrogenase family protein [Idiomarina xiamenensis]|uniref:3-hydroxybutyryl-CoA dehydrogenase n=1 Tax=Idiomarina xiamenensis 10-D-4 TaxID=740709 RepID=K2K2D4_9GAMM|nr:3-hydroxyacyl-CoA dehydrogenase NAD-binding domain-containing protein [Idiomarina xiamenensis]EKE80862.1 3-hydroxybutyryl-CoA dehydrogenase [Idiomarina xiamenensis 10-D-4]
MNIIGVIGAGVMGRGLAQDLAQHGHQVLLNDISEEILADAKSSIAQNLRAQKMLGQNPKITESTDTIIARITTSTELDFMGDAHFVVENVTEKWNIKKHIYPKLDTICHKDVVFAANTSAISITKVGSLTSRPDQVLGIHFMNPVPMKHTVELIKGYHTSEKSLDVARTFLGSFGKRSVLVNDAPGFVSNRVLMLTINEAAWLVQDGVASATDVDDVFVSCFGHTMGPLATGDLIGLDTILYSVEVLYEAFNDSKYRPCPLLKKMVDAGLHGCKNGEGFFKY